MDKTKIGRFIAAQRKRLGLTQAQLAELLDVSNKTISRWERGINVPNYDQVLLACRFFDVDVRDFMLGNITEADACTTAVPPSEHE